MTLMQGADTVFWEAMTLLFAGISILLTWLMILAGRDYPPSRQKRAEETVARFGDIEEDHAPLPIFLKAVYLLIGLWSVFYLFWNGVQGLGF